MHNNQEIYEILLPLVVEKVAPEKKSAEGIAESGPLEVNCFSICFWANLVEESGGKRVYVKIPKIVLYDKEKQNIMPLSGDDRELAENEYNSLVHLSKYWKSNDIHVQFVKPLGFIEEFNAIITERFYAEHFFKLYRKQDIKRRMSMSSKPDVTSVAMSRLGKALARFHNQSGTEKFTFQIDDVIAKIRGYASELKAYGANAEFLSSIVEKMESYRGFTDSTQASINLKGFDIRQVFIDNSDCLYLLDPGKMKDGFQEVDLARFIVTCRILYWGSSAIFLRLVPSTFYEESFLKGYYGDNKGREKILRFLIIKELFKHWRMAGFIVNKRPWSQTYKRFLAKAYMNPFYKRQIKRELLKLECA